jgi:hypothetical protein
MTSSSLTLKRAPYQAVANKQQTIITPGKAPEMLTVVYLI